MKPELAVVLPIMGVIALAFVCILVRRYTGIKAALREVWGICYTPPYIVLVDDPEHVLLQLLREAGCKISCIHEGKPSHHQVSYGALSSFSLVCCGRKHIVIMDNEWRPNALQFLRMLEAKTDVTGGR